MAGRINVDMVIGLVSEDVRGAIRRLAYAHPQPAEPGHYDWKNARVVCDGRRGYLQQLDEASLANWAAVREVTIRLLVRPGDCMFPGAPVALTLPPVEDADAVFRRATAVGEQRVSDSDLADARRRPRQFCAVRAQGAFGMLPEDEQ